MFWIITAIIAIGLGIYFYKNRKKNRQPIEFPPSWRAILDQKVLFYHNLGPEEKDRFEHDVNRFLKKVQLV